MQVNDTYGITDGFTGTYENIKTAPVEILNVAAGVTNASVDSTAKTANLVYKMVPAAATGFLAVGSTFEYEFVISNTGSTDMGWKVEITTPTDNFKAYIGTDGTRTLNDNGTLIGATTGTKTVTVTFEVIAPAEDADNEDTYTEGSGYYAMAANTELPGITISLKNGTFKN